MNDMTPLKLTPLSDYSDKQRKAVRDVTDLLNRNKKAHVGWWAYQNGNSKLFTAVQRALKDYTYFHHVNSIIEDKKSTIASELKDTNTAILLGAAEAVETKELKIILEMLKQNPEALKKIVLIDVSEAFNAAAKNIVQEAVHRINPEIEIVTIDKDVFDLDDADIKVCQDGIVSLFAMGGLGFNSPGDVSHGLPRGQISKFFTQMSKIISFGKAPEKNSFIMDHKEPMDDVTKMTREYAAKPTIHDVPSVYLENGKVNGIEVEKANFEYFFLSCFSYMLNNVPDFSKLNPALCDRNGDVTPESLIPYFGHYNKFDLDSSNMVNGLIANKKVTIRLPNEDGEIISISVGRDEPYVMFNTIYPETDYLDNIMRDISQIPLMTTSSFKAPNAEISNVVTISRPVQKLELAA